MTAATSPTRWAWLPWIGLLVMTGGLIYGFGWGNGWAEVRELTGYPWFNVSLIDVYTGFVLFAAWIVFRERNVGLAVLWIVLLMTLGNFLSCIYVLLAVYRAQGQWAVFWMGHRAPPDASSTGVP